MPPWMAQLVEVTSGVARADALDHVTMPQADKHDVAGARRSDAANSEYQIAVGEQGLHGPAAHDSEDSDATP